MIIAAYLFLMLFLSVYLEILFGTFGIILPLTALLIYYLSAVFGWGVFLFIGIIAGIFIDSLYGRSIFISPAVLGGVAMIPAFWTPNPEKVPLMLYTLPGMIASAGTVGPVLLLHNLTEGISLQSGLHQLSQLLFAVFCGAILMPSLILLLDFIAFKLGIETFRKIRKIGAY